MKVASYNIHKCRGADGMTRPDRIVGVIGELGAEVVALQEVDRRFGRRGGLLDPVAIERETGMRLLVQSDVSHRHGWHGNALLVRREPKAYRRLRLKLPGANLAGPLLRNSISAGASFASLPLTSACFAFQEWIRSTRF